MGLDNYIEFAMKSLLKDILPPSISYSLFFASTFASGKDNHFISPQKAISKSS
jgi:hypothetical protein